LRKNFYEINFIHGDIFLNKGFKRLIKSKSKEIKIIISIDPLCWGIDVKDVDLITNHGSFRLNNSSKFEAKKKLNNICNIYVCRYRRVYKNNFLNKKIIISSTDSKRNIDFLNKLTEIHNSSTNETSLK